MEQENLIFKAEIINKISSNLKKSQDKFVICFENGPAIGKTAYATRYHKNEDSNLKLIECKVGEKVIVVGKVLKDENKKFIFWWILKQKEAYDEITLDELKIIFLNDDFIPYSQFLRTFEWKKKKEEINFRDNYLCVICGAFETELDNNSNYIWKKNIFSDNKSKIDINSLIEKFPKWKPNKEYKLHVHHKLYKKNKLPWDYENHNLITLCNNCHENIHKFINIPVLNEFDITIDDYVTCDRCNGSGYFPEYNHIKNGICFKCNGERYNLFIIDKNIPI